jgi:hypothetical protein
MSKDAYVLIYPPSQKTTGLPVDECQYAQIGVEADRCAMSHGDVADNRGVAEGEDG